MQLDKKTQNILSAYLTSFTVNFFLAVAMMFLIYETAFSAGIKLFILRLCMVILYIIAVFLHIRIMKKFNLRENKKNCIIWCVITILEMIPLTWKYVLIYI